MFKINHEEAMDFGEIKPGEYEIVVAKAFENANSNTGAEFMDIQLVVRNDLQQEEQGKWIFHKVYKSKETGQYHSGMINTLAKALNIPNGMQFNTAQDLLNHFLLKVAKVKVGTREYEGKTYTEVKNWEVSAFPQLNHQWKDGKMPVNGVKQESGFTGIEGFDTIDDDNIPF